MWIMLNNFSSIKTLIYLVCWICASNTNDSARITCAKLIRLGIDDLVFSFIIRKFQNLEIRTNLFFYIQRLKIIYKRYVYHLIFILFKTGIKQLIIKSRKFIHFLMWDYKKLKWPTIPYAHTFIHILQFILWPITLGHYHH